MKLRWDKWFYGIGAAIIGGGSSAVVSGLTSALAFHVDVTTWAGLVKTVSLMMINFVLMGILSMFFYLKQNSAPEIVSETTFTTNAKQQNPDGSVVTSTEEVNRTTTVTQPDTKPKDP